MTRSSLRDNYIDNEKPSWLKKFRKWPDIEMIMNMMNLSNQPTVEECKENWTEIIESEQFAMITTERMRFIPETYKKYQYTTYEDEDLNDTGFRDYEQNEFTAFNSKDNDSILSGELFTREK